MSAGPGGERRRGGSRAVALATVLIAVAVAIGVLKGRISERSAARAAFPTSEGQLWIEGLRAPVEVVRDANGIPHVLAATEPSAHGWWFSRSTR